jgi:hypothetical protein
LEQQQQLTEGIIKKVALRFFRHYYKFRLRYEDQPVTAKYDLEGVGGVVADGYYSFKKPDGQPFTATFEATSKESKGEVMFQPERRILRWDGMAVTGLALVLLAFYNLRNPLHLLDNVSYLERLALLVGAGGVAYAVFWLVARNFSRYRYIYAVEQFKKYFADEQWIALGGDVFEDKNDPHLRELKRQCVVNGFGLLTVDANLDPKIIIAPSRHDIFAGKRRRVEFMEPGKLRQVAQRSRLELGYSLFGGALSGLLQPDKTLLRHRRSFAKQAAILAGCGALLAVIFAKEMENPAFRLVEKQEYDETIAKSKSNNLPEPETVLPDTSSMPRRKERGGEFWELKKPEAPVVQQPIADGGGPKPYDEFTPRGADMEYLYDCARFYNFYDGKKYIVEVGEYSEAVAARTEVYRLRSKKVPAAALLKSCFTEEKKGYIVYAGEIYNSADEASKAMDGWGKSEAVEAPVLRRWKIRLIEPMGQ